MIISSEAKLNKTVWNVQRLVERRTAKWLEMESIPSG